MPVPTNTSVPPGVIVVDHTSVELFDQIPEQYLTAARNLDQVFSDRSVGGNISMYLDCLAAAADWWNTPAYCRNDYVGGQWTVKLYNQADYQAGTVPDRILFDPDPVRYSRSSWTYEYRTGEWPDLTEDFITSLAPQYINTKDVLSYQFSYLNVSDGDDIADPRHGLLCG